MKFSNLTIQNFGSIGKMELPLADQGLVLILGRNEDAPKADSNGAGKSLPLDAFTWALWGETVRGFSTEEVVHHKVGKNCTVEVTFTDDGQDYTVRRLRRNSSDKDHKPNDLILLHGKEEVSGASIAATQVQIEELLGLDFVTFCAMMPGAGITVATMTDAQVKSLLEKLLRTEALGKASEEARKRHRTVSNELIEQNTHLRDTDSSLREVEGRIASLRLREDTYLDENKAKIDSIDTQISGLEKRRDSLNDTISREGEVDSSIDIITSEITAMSSGLASFNRKTTEADTAHAGRVVQLEIDLSLAEERWKKAKEAVTDIASAGNTCPLCTQGVGDEQRTKLKQYEELTSRVVDALTKTKSAAEAHWYHEEQEAISTRREKELLIEEKETSLTTLNTMKREIAAARLTRDSFSTQLSLLEANKKDLQSTANPYVLLLKEENELLDTTNSKRADLAKTILTKEEASSILSFWVESFSPSGIRSFMLEHVTPLLNQFAKKYADLITDGEMEVAFHTKDTLKSGKTKERFNIQVTQKHGGASYASNSSGERARANLIISLALGELASLRAAKTLPFRFLDEPFESIDELGTEAIITLLNQQREQYNTVYVVTHQDSLKQMFQNKLTIVKKDGYSVIED